jgi:hypothetical protein
MTRAGDASEVVVIQRPHTAPLMGDRRPLTLPPSAVQPNLISRLTSTESGQPELLEEDKPHITDVRRVSD